MTIFQPLSVTTELVAFVAVVESSPYLLLRMSAPRKLLSPILIDAMSDSVVFSGLATSWSSSSGFSAMTLTAVGICDGSGSWFSTSVRAGPWAPFGSWT